MYHLVKITFFFHGENADSENVVLSCASMSTVAVFQIYDENSERNSRLAQMAKFNGPLSTVA